jgi:superfamily I DNA/RNA helicase
VVIDGDGNSENRSDTISVFNGPPPTIHSLQSESDETKTVASWIAEHAKAGVLPHELGVFVRSEAELGRACVAVKATGIAFQTLDENVETTSGHVSIGTMHLAKGLEFRAVVVMACDDEIIPLQERMRQSATTLICRRFMKRSATCYTWHALAPGTICSLPASIRCPNFWTTSRRVIRLVPCMGEANRGSFAIPAG